jgi:hypothetical protein
MGSGFAILKGAIHATALKNKKAAIAAFLRTPA